VHFQQQIDLQMLKLADTKPGSTTLWRIERLARLFEKRGGSEGYDAFVVLARKQLLPMALNTKNDYEQERARDLWARIRFHGRYPQFTSTTTGSEEGFSAQLPYAYAHIQKQSSVQPRRTASLPADVSAKLDAAKEACRAGDYRRAVSLTRGVLSVDPYSAEAYFLSGYALFELGDAAGALNSHQGGLIYDSKNSEFWRWYREKFDPIGEASH
jgi:tetratricopeptide (TPR) repeat protein